MTKKDFFIEWYKKRFEGLNQAPPEEVWKNIEQDLEVNNWYTKEFEKLNTAPPEDVWKNIEQGLEVNNWYTKEFEKLNITPPVEVWEVVSENISINEAWKNIESSLAAKQRRKIIARRSSVATLLLLLLFMSGYLLFREGKSHIGEKAVYYSDSRSAKFTQNTTTGSNDDVVSGHGGESKKSKFTNEAIETEAAKNTITKKVTEPKVAGSSVAVLSQPVSVSSVKEEAAVTSEKSYQKNNNSQYQNSSYVLLQKENTPVTNNAVLTNNTPEQESVNIFLQLPPKNITIVNPAPDLSLTSAQLIIDTSLAEKKQDAGTAFRGLYAGAVYSANNIWLLNNQTFNGFKSTSFDQTNINSGSAYGLALGYSINNHWLTELNVYLNSHQGQTYHVYEEGRYLSKNVSLNYTVFNLSVKQRKATFTKFKKLQQSHGIIAGINYGYLKSAKNIYDERTEITKDNYRLADFGLRLGYGYEILMFRKLLISGCVQTNIGLNNIYSGTDLIPGSFNRTHTAGIGAEFGIKYLLK